jgi:hypothetical protein
MYSNVYSSIKEGAFYCQNMKLKIYSEFNAVGIHAAVDNSDLEVVNTFHSHSGWVLLRWDK